MGVEKGGVCPTPLLLPHHSPGEVVKANDGEPLIEHLLCAGPWGETEMNEVQLPMTTQRVPLTEHD